LSRLKLEPQRDPTVLNRLEHIETEDEHLQHELDRVTAELRDDTTSEDAIPTAGRYLRLLEVYKKVA
jgi:hypothetical protein